MSEESTTQATSTIDTLLSGLNKEQAEAVTSNSPALLIAAGAGSGKTRVITYRIAWILNQKKANPSQILAITFTNKAATEMKERLQTLIGPAAKNMWISTFHSACVRILRHWHEAAELDRNFTIYDQQDSEKLIKNIENDLNIDSKQYTPRSVLSQISRYKNKLQNAQDILHEYNLTYTPGKSHGSLTTTNKEQTTAFIYAEYQHRLHTANAIDFDDIINTTITILHNNPTIAHYYQQKFTYIFVDEYQDTNYAQYTLIRELGGYTTNTPTPHANITVVGDADQSIYAFRGADISIIRNFEHDFPQAHTVFLEQNYRSTQNILDAANAVIAVDHQGKIKKLRTNSSKGDRITGYVANTAKSEAQYIVTEIKHLHQEQHIPYSDIAIMYRTNAQSRYLEEALTKAPIPYQLIGGTRFYDRQEIKDALAYLRVIANPNDDISLQRILNVPHRGIGKQTEQTVMEYARQKTLSFWTALHQVADFPIASHSQKKIESFIHLIEGFITSNRQGIQPSALLDTILHDTGLLDELRQAATVNVQEENRLENLAQLQSIAEEYEKSAEEPALNDFLESISLSSDLDQLTDTSDGAVILMTLHTAKGLEYPVVFLCGFEEGLFPHIRSLNNENELAEERRLAYVGITRAKQKLYITRAQQRSQWGRVEESEESRFLTDIKDMIDWNFEAPQPMHKYHSYDQSSWNHSSWNNHASYSHESSSSMRKSKPVSSRHIEVSHSVSRPTKPANQQSFAPGDRVTHDSYGLGKVLATDGKTVTVDFGSDGVKRLLIRLAPLEKL
ncbi:MAG: UvrD-helicase domain-containing protein [Aeriscardovia sp.]|nr:UvrD-helicase domain-containing protein [Aeriscardovia sp.]